MLKAHVAILEKEQARPRPGASVVRSEPAAVSFTPHAVTTII